MAKRMRCFDGHVDLSEDVVIEILLRLPVESLSRFKCVCKDWYNIIESLEFHKQHFALQSNLEHILVSSTSRFLSPCYTYEALIISGENLTTMEILDIPIKGNLIGPCRGLFLTHQRLPCDNGGTCLNLWNPATRSFKLLPDMPDVINYPGPSAYGLGWDSTIDDCKVVCFICRHSRFVAAVYTLRSDSWRILDLPLPELDIRCIWNSHKTNVHTNGICYWLPSFKCVSSSLVSFDVTREIFETVPLPPIGIGHPSYTGWESTFSAYYNSLALLAHVRTSIEVWVLRQEQQLYWTKIYEIRDINLSITPVGFWNDTHVLLRQYRARQVEVLVHDMNNNHVEKVIKFPMDRDIGAIYNYKKSLFSIKRKE